MFCTKDGNYKNNQSEIIRFCLDKKAKLLKFDNDYEEKLTQIVEDQLMRFYDNKEKFGKFFNRTYSQQFSFKYSLTQILIYQAFENAKKRYYQLFPYTPNLILDLALPKDPWYETNVTEMNFIKMLEVLKDSNTGTGMNSFAYLMVSELFRIYVDSDKQANELISTLITLLETSKDAKNWNKINLFNMGKQR